MLADLGEAERAGLIEVAARTAGGALRSRAALADHPGPEHRSGRAAYRPAHPVGAQRDTKIDRRRLRVDQERAGRTGPDTIAPSAPYSSPASSTWRSRGCKSIAAGCRSLTSAAPSTWRHRRAARSSARAAPRAAARAGSAGRTACRPPGSTARGARMPGPSDRCRGPAPEQPPHRDCCPPPCRRSARTGRRCPVPRPAPAAPPERYRGPRAPSRPAAHRPRWTTRRPARRQPGWTS